MGYSGYSRSPKLLKGALIQFTSATFIPIPNVIVFQYNPESLTRTLNTWEAPLKEGETPDAPRPQNQVNPRAQPYDPTESFNLTLELDAADALEEPLKHPVAVVSGVADRIAAMEMLLYPPADSATASLGISIDISIGGAGAAASAGAGAAVKPVERKTVPVVLFFWGPGRIVPVRVTSFSVEEQAFSPLLYPLRAKVNLGLTILEPAAFGNEDGAVVEIAKAAYKFTRTQKEVLALANLANSVESILGMLPF